MLHEKARRAEELKTAHDDAMFGGPSALPSIISNDEPEAEDEEVPRGKHNDPEPSSLVSEKVNKKYTQLNKKLGMSV